MSTDAAVTKDLIQTLEDGKEGFAKGAEKLAESDRPEWASAFRQNSEQRQRLSTELQQLAQSYGDDLPDSGTVAGTLHRGWMTLKDALSGSDPHGVLDAAEQGEDHAVAEFEKALDDDLSPQLRIVVERQLTEVRAARDQVKAMRQAS